MLALSRAPVRFATAKVPTSRFSSTVATSTPKAPRFKWTKRVLKGSAAVGLAVFAWTVYESRHPLPQFEWDHSKETIAILGTGWGSTSLLKDLDTENYNVVLVSPRAYFLFTPLLPSSTVGTVELRSIMQPIRFLTRFKRREILYVEGNCTNIDPTKKVITVEDSSEIQGAVSKSEIKYDYLVVGVGAENATFGIPGVKENACFLKEAWDARRIRTQLLDCLESATFPGQPESEINRLLHMVVVGGGPTGVEYAAELHDFLNDDIQTWYPDIAGKFKITLVEATPHVLGMFPKDLIQYTERTFAENKVEILNNTMVKEVHQKDILVLNKDKELETIPFGLLVWATGNTARPLVSDLISKLPKDLQNQRRGLVVDDWLAVKGSKGSIYALGDCSATKWAPTAQVASRQGAYLAEQFAQLYALKREKSKFVEEGNKPEEFLQKLQPFVYNHQGSLAYVGGDKAIADLPFGIHLSGAMTYLFWRSAYMSNLFSLRNRVLVGFDWLKAKTFGRDISRE
ncbi:NADH:ubiquinone oxidoreductase [Rhizoclosmatium sp. JEL0117]|nr:NADH:ubiquinone oxidoreductase [Rhizoclosmatium sp. JEL0117]